MLTLREIKQRVKNPGKGKVPTAKCLQEKEEVVVSKYVGMETGLKVYGCGYVVYRSGKRVTVFPVHACGDYLYHSCAGIYCIKESFFDCQAWYVRLILEGEDRVNRNRESRDRERNISYSAVAEDWHLLVGIGQSPLDQIIEEEKIGEIMELLTERQRLIFGQYFLYQKSQKEIAEELDVAAPIISKAISNSIRKIRKKYPEIMKYEVSHSVCNKKGGNAYAW